MKKALIGIGIFLAAAVLGVGVWLGPAVWDFARAGVFEGQERREYTGGRMEDLKAQHLAVMLYSESEGALPDASGWMDAAMTRAETADLGRDEALKKFKSPVAQGEEEFGYAMNEALSQVYPGDVESPEKTVLIFESSDLVWNAFGDPKKLRPNPPRADGNKAVTLAGEIVAN